MPKALQHEYPRYTGDSDEPREVWHGALRSVSAKRARKLRKRGVPLMPLHSVWSFSAHNEPITSGNGPGKRSARYAWFECKDDAERRIGRRRLQCYLTATQADPNTLGRKAELARRLADQRADHAAHEYFRKGGKLAATTYFQTFERRGLYAGVIHENVLNPQLDLYAEVARQIGLEPQASLVDADTYSRELWARPIRDTMEAAEQHFREVHGLEGEALRERMPICWEPANAGVPTHYEPNEYTRALFRNATPEQLEAAKAVDVSDFHEGLKRAKLAEWERTRYAKPLLDPSYAGAPHADCDCMACRPYTG